ncbi:hypothetical protein BGZ54_008548 [Gamsiella multidivaricata]|nr:hypothetical protein BGZ54_008548 [Gamsiella multidivaricata]
MTLFYRHTGQLRTWARRVLWCIIVIGSLCAIVIPIFSIYRKEGDNARSVVEVAPRGVSHTGDYIHVVGSVASVDFEDKNFRVHFEFTPHGALAGDDGVLSAAIVISLFYTTLTFPESQIMRSVDVTMPYMQGATIDYPFDAYKSYFEILANKKKEQLHKIPVSLTFLGMLQSVEFIPTVHLSNDDLYKISIEIFTRRSPTTIGFSLFIVVIMWALSIAIGIIAIQVIRKYRVTDEHVLTLGITTLFALPALRETQPGIPAIGCAADVLGFYWNMAIIAISSIMIVMASALRWKEPSLQKELELVHKQHDFQSKLISEMAIPMPFPITGGPFSDYQVKKKRIPFMMTHHHEDIESTMPSMSSSMYSQGGHEYHRTSMDGYYYTDDPEYRSRMTEKQQQLEQKQQKVQENQKQPASLHVQEQRQVSQTRLGSADSSGGEHLPHSCGSGTLGYHYGSSMHSKNSLSTLTSHDSLRLSASKPHQEQFPLQYHANPSGVHLHDRQVKSLAVQPAAATHSAPWLHDTIGATGSSIYSTDHDNGSVHETQLQEQQQYPTFYRHSSTPPVSSAWSSANSNSNSNWAHPPPSSPVPSFSPSATTMPTTTGATYASSLHSNSTTSTVTTLHHALYRR